jgi:SecD/SecF fusion protein
LETLLRRNNGKALAIVLDGKVVFAPVVQGEIAGGHCTITGGFTTAQVKYIAAIGSNGELPVGFKVVN